MDFLQAVYQIVVLLVFNFDGQRIFHLHNESQEHADKIKNTFVFNAFVFCQVRSLEDFSSNNSFYNFSETTVCCHFLRYAAFLE
jgi:hypothetical protein